MCALTGSRSVDVFFNCVEEEEEGGEEMEREKWKARSH